MSLDDVGRFNLDYDQNWTLLIVTDGKTNHSLPKRLVRNYRKAEEALENAEEDIREYLRATGQPLP